MKRIAREQIDQALEQLTESPQEDQNEAIHKARKRFKKIRAVLRLVRDELEAAARSLGERIYAEKPKAFVSRIATYWSVWQKEKAGNYGID